MFVLVVEFRIHAEFVAAFGAAIHDNARASLATEPGCRQFDVCRDPAEPTLFYLYEVYDDEAAFQAHLKTGHFAAMERASAGWVASKTVRRLWRDGAAGADDLAI
jgi:(4S)-4-hydroxy-5-phosphonooxypentane-2,3-dione isomerase